MNPAACTRNGLRQVERMEPRICKNCGQEFAEWVEFCSNCAEPMEDYSRPAGFWIRVGAWIIDCIVFIPVGILSNWNFYVLKSTLLPILICLIGLIYIPFMHSFFGATLGKMACRIKVIDDHGNRLSLPRAYIRFLPFLASTVISLVNQLLIFSSPHFQSVTSSEEFAKLRQSGPLNTISTVVLSLILIECIFAGFTDRKRALHDMIAGSFCVYKEPGE